MSKTQDLLDDHATWCVRVHHYLLDNGWTYHDTWGYSLEGVIENETNHLYALKDQLREEKRRVLRAMKDKG